MTRGEVHERVGAAANGQLELPDLFVEARRHGRRPDISVDLHSGDIADSHRLEPAREMVDIRRNDQATSSYFGANDFWRKAFALGYERYRVGNFAAPRGRHLRAHSDSLRRYKPDQVRRCDLSRCAGTRV